MRACAFIIASVFCIAAIAAPTSRPASRQVPKDKVETFTDRAKDAIKNGYTVTNDSGKVERGRYSRQEVKEVLASAERIDKAIQAQIDGGLVEEGVAPFLWAGTPAPGMTIEQLRIFCEMRTRTERGKEIAAYLMPWNPRTKDRIMWAAWFTQREGSEITEVANVTRYPDAQQKQVQARNWN